MRAAPYARILLAILSLVALATSASADCAWLLWAQHLNGPHYREWYIVGSFESKKGL